MRIFRAHIHRLTVNSLRKYFQYVPFTYIFKLTRNKFSIIRKPTRVPHSWLLKKWVSGSIHSVSNYQLNIKPYLSLNSIIDLWDCNLCNVLPCFHFPRHSKFRFFSEMFHFNNAVFSSVILATKKIINQIVSHLLHVILQSLFYAQFAKKNVSTLSPFWQ